MKLQELNERLKDKGEKLSRAKRIRSLIQKQKGLIKNKESLTDFKEPVLFLVRRGGKMDIYEDATTGKFTFEHSTGNARQIELRLSDQITFDYANRRVRGYVGHEDRPFANWDNPVVDSESVMLGYEKTKATDLKYQERIARLKNAGKLTWVWIILGIAGALAIAGFAYATWVQPALANKAKADAEIFKPVAGALLMMLKIKLSRKI